MNTNEFIDGIKKLNKYSSKKEIESFLYYDMKQEANYSNENLELIKNKLKESEYKETDKLDLNYNYLDENDTDEEYLKNWLKYKSFVRFFINFDSDTTSKVLKILNLLLEKQGLKCEYEGGRSFSVFDNNQKYYLETDTMNSFMRIFQLFFMIINKQSNPYPATRKNCYQLLNDETFQNLIIKKVEEFENKEEALKTYESIKKFAKLQNTIGNYVMVPKFFNFNRGYNDFFDIAIENYENIFEKINKDEKINFDRKELKDTYEWYKLNCIDNNDLMCIKNYFYDNGKLKLISIKDNGEYYPSTLSEIRKYLDNVNNIILKRGLEIILKLNESDLENNPELINIKN